MTHAQRISALRGVVVPLVTPLSDHEALDLPALGRVVDHVIGGGVHAVFSLGTTGEFARFNGSERTRIAAATARAVGGRVPVLVGVSDAGTRLVIEHARAAADAGADAIVVSLPYYFPIRDEREVVSFYEEVARASSLPMILYNIPATTGASIGLSAFKHLLELETIVGMKDSGGNLEYLRELISAARARPGFPVFVGDERLCVEGLAAGASGLVPSLANVFPGIFVELFQAAMAGDAARAAELGRVVTEMNTLNLYSGSWLSAVAWRKAALARMGICGETMTSPSVPLDEATRNSIARLVASQGGPS